MAWATSYDPTHEIVEVVYTGSVPFTEVREAAATRIKLQEETGATRIIINASAIDTSTVSTMDIFSLPAKTYNDRKVSRLTRMAIFLPTPKEEMETVQFFETACINRGWTAKIFKNRQDAIDWLIDLQTSD